MLGGNDPPNATAHSEGYAARSLIELGKTPVAVKRELAHAAGHVRRSALSVGARPQTMLPGRMWPDLVICIAPASLPPQAWPTQHNIRVGTCRAAARTPARTHSMHAR